MTSPWVSLATVALVALLLASCEESPSEDRILQAPIVDTVFQVGSATDSTLLTPQGLVGGRDAVFVLDLQSKRVTSISSTGEVRWTYHVSGQGPNELSAPVAGVATPSGGVRVLDVGNRKLVEFSSDGNVASEVSLVGMNSPLAEAVQLDDTLLLTTDVTGHAVVVNVRSGEVGESLPLRPEVDPPGGFVFQTALARMPHESKWVAGMRYGPEFWIGDGISATESKRLIVHPGYRVRGRSMTVGDMQRPDPTDLRQQAGYGTASITTDEASIYVLTGGSPFRVGGQNNVLDVYDLSGSYRYSYRLPLAGMAITKVGDVFYLLSVGPTPTLLAFRITD